MREINNNNLDITKLQGATFKHDATENAEPKTPMEPQDAKVKDFSNPTAEALGRSQVHNADNLKSDVDFAKANPEVIEKADKLFELALKSLQADNDPDAYEKACAIATSEDSKAILQK